MFSYVSFISTNDEDLEFNYLSKFGPRFRKLTDMYKKDPSDEESDGAENETMKGWC